MSTGKLYYLTNGTLYYIGSTSKSLEERLQKHMVNYKSYLKRNKGFCTSFKLFEDTDVKDIKIELIEDMGAVSKQELFIGEGHRIRMFMANHGELCVNRKIEGRDAYEYRKDNKEKIDANNKQYYQDNKDALKKKKNEVLHCPHCSKTFTRSNKSQHMKRYHN